MIDFRLQYSIRIKVRTVSTSNCLENSKRVILIKIMISTFIFKIIPVLPYENQGNDASGL